MPFRNGLRHLRGGLLCLALAGALPLAVAAHPLSIPHLALPQGTGRAPQVALTLDACSGATDTRILRVLIDNQVKATIFATARWLKRNPAALAEINRHPDLFRVENHGARHLAAVLTPGRVYGVRTVGSAQGLKSEIEDGAAAVTAATGRAPHWFRGATAEYSSDALREIAALGEAVAGFSLLGDGGAQFSASHAAAAISSAHDGDVIIAHINQPGKPAGAGVATGVLALKAKGFRFVWLDDGKPLDRSPQIAARPARR